MAKRSGGGCQRASRNGTICAQRAPTCAIYRVLARKSEPLRPRKSQTTGHNLRKEPRCATRTVAMGSSFQGYALQAPTVGSLLPDCFAEAPSRSSHYRYLGMVSYPNNVTVYPYNGCIGGANPIVRRVMSLTCTLNRMHANQHAPKHAATQPL